MSIDILSKDIFLKAEDEKKLIEQEALKDMSKLQEEFDERISSFKNILSKKHENEISYQKEKILGEYKKQSKKIVLDMKTKLLEDVYSNALENLNSLKGDKKRNFFKNIINSVKDFKYSCVKCSKKDSKLLRELLPKEIKVSIDENVNGAIFVSDDGKQIVDMTIESVLRYAFESAEEKIQEVLYRY